METSWQPTVSLDVEALRLLAVSTTTGMPVETACRVATDADREAALRHVATVNEHLETIRQRAPALRRDAVWRAVLTASVTT